MLIRAAKLNSAPSSSWSSRPRPRRVRSSGKTNLLKIDSKKLHFQMYLITFDFVIEHLTTSKGRGRGEVRYGYYKCLPLLWQRASLCFDSSSNPLSVSTPRIISIWKKYSSNIYCLLTNFPHCMTVTEQNLSFTSLFCTWHMWFIFIYLQIGRIFPAHATCTLIATVWLT